MKNLKVFIEANGHEVSPIVLSKEDTLSIDAVSQLKVIINWEQPNMFGDPELHLQLIKKG